MGFVKVGPRGGQSPFSALRSERDGRESDAKPVDGSNLELRLVTAQRLGLVAGAKPTRTWKPRKVWVARDGIFPKNRKCLSDHAPYESSLEAIAHLYLSVDIRIKAYACQPHTLRYWMPNAEGGQDQHEYTPDFVAMTDDGRLLVIDAKANRFATHHKWIRREPFIRASYHRDFGADLLVWTERDLKAEQRLSNARALYRHRFEPHDKSAELEARRLLAAYGRSTIGQLCDELVRSAAHTRSEAYSAILRLALTGEFSLDERTRYCRNTAVSFRSSSA